MLTETDKRDEETDTSTNSQDERLGHDPGEPLPETEQRKNEEDPAFHEDGGQRLPIGDHTRPIEANDVVCELKSAISIFAGSWKVR